MQNELTLRLRPSARFLALGALLLVSCGGEDSSAAEKESSPGLEEAVEETMLEIDATGDFDLERMTDERLTEMVEHQLDEVETAFERVTEGADLPLQEWRSELDEARERLAEVTDMEPGDARTRARETLLESVSSLRNALEGAGLELR